MGVFVTTLAMTIPFSLTLRGALEEHLAASLAAAQAADGVNYDWWQEFEAQAAGLATTFTPSILGFAAVLENTSGILDARRPIAPVAGALAAYLLVWMFLSGGIIDRFARQRPTRAQGFFAAAGVYWPRFLRLGVVAGLVYWMLFAIVHPWLFGTLFRIVTREVNAEREAFAWRLAFYLVFAALLASANVLFDFARIRAVVEDRRSMVMALAASARFILRNRWRVSGLYGLNAAAFLSVLAVWALVAPGAGGAGVTMWLGIALAQVYIGARLFLKLHFIASETALFQASLAHAVYAAAPTPKWPESPSAEAIGRPELT